MWKKLMGGVAAALLLTVLACTERQEALGPDLRAQAARPAPEGAGNNLSFPVIWAEGKTKVLRGTYGEVDTDGAWWWWWGYPADEHADPYACAPDPDDNAYCDDGIGASVTGNLPGTEPPGTVYKAYLQKDSGNEWQAWSGTLSGEVVVDTIDWGDALESVPWYLNSQVRIEHALYKLLETPVTEYAMLHTSGWGITEVWGLSVSGEGYTHVDAGAGDKATVYSPCARLTLQKLNVARDAVAPGALIWSPTTHAWVEAEDVTENLINPPIFNRAAHEALDGPGYYSAEINVKGMIIFGYTWNVRTLNDGAGDYRITFSLDATCPTTPVNTFFRADVTVIRVAAEEEVAISEEPTGDGGTAYIDYANNLTYMDIHILDGKGGGGGGGGGGGKGPRK